jgi:hypothetical protein
LLAPFFAFCAAVAHLTSVRAEIQNRASTECPGKICFWYQSMVTPPKGWKIDEAESAAHHLTILFPDKKKLDFRDPMIYVQTSKDADPVDKIIARNLDDFRKEATPRAKFTDIGEAPRAEGKPPFKLYLFENPDAPRQAVEKLAFGVEVLPNGEHYFLIVVDTAANRRAIDDSSAAFLEILKGL